jgi:starch phosphorylase
LENEIIPEFYKRDEQGIPRGWVARVRASMARLTPEFSASRTVRQYTEEHYIPLNAAYALRSKADSKAAESLRAWREHIALHWDGIHFGGLKINQNNGELVFEAEVFLGALDPCAVRVELYAASQNGAPALRQEMHRTAGPEPDQGVYVYTARTPGDRPATDFTPRMFPYHALALPTEGRRIVWQR